MNYSLTLTQDQIDIIIDKFQEYEVSITNYYTLFRAKIKLSTLTIFTTGKLLIQGKESYCIYKDICDTLGLKIEYDETKQEKDINIENIKIFESYIGNDEVGTGDFFGPIVVCSSCVDENNYLYVKRLGVKDSKAITSDEKILEIGEKLINTIPHTVTILTNTKYNEVITNPNMNMNKVKAVLHNNVINKFLNKYKDLKYNSIVIDDFCGEQKYYEYLSNSKNLVKNIIFETKAENKYLSVACSSIIARYYFLKEIEKLSEISGYNILKGASSKVDKLASEIIKDKGTSFLSKIAKLNFKNFSKAKNLISKNK